MNLREGRSGIGTVRNCCSICCAEDRRSNPDLVATLKRNLSALGSRIRAPSIDDGTELLRSRGKPPSPRWSATKNLSGTVGRRSRIVGKASAQLDPKGALRSSPPSPPPPPPPSPTPSVPPLNKEMLALFCVSSAVFPRCPGGCTSNSTPQCHVWQQMLETL